MHWTRQLAQSAESFHEAKSLALQIARLLNVSAKIQVVRRRRSGADDESEGPSIFRCVQEPDGGFSCYSADDFDTSTSDDRETQEEDIEWCVSWSLPRQEDMDNAWNQIYGLHDRTLMDVVAKTSDAMGQSKDDGLEGKIADETLWLDEKYRQVSALVDEYSDENPFEEKFLDSGDPYDIE